MVKASGAANVVTLNFLQLFVNKKFVEKKKINKKSHSVLSYRNHQNVEAFLDLMLFVTWLVKRNTYLITIIKHIKTCSLIKLIT